MAKGRYKLKTSAIKGVDRSIENELNRPKPKWKPRTYNENQTK